MGLAARGELRGKKLPEAVWASDMGTGPRFAKAPDIPALVLAPEQRVGRIAMRGGGETVLLDPRDLAFEKVDACRELVLRVGPEVLARELARRVAFRPGTVLVFHCGHIVPPGVLAVNAAPR